MPEKAKRRGRPTKPPVAGERVPLSLRVTADAKQRLEASAEQNGRSLSQEAEVRLEQSFRDDDLLPQLMAAAYGERLAGILMMMGSAMSMVGRQAGFAQTFTLEGSANWIDQPWPYLQAQYAAEHILDTLRPEGEAVPPQALVALGELPSLPAGLSDHYGRGFANGYLAAAAGEGVTAELRRWSDLVRRLLGAELVERIKKSLPRGGGKPRRK